MYLPHSFNIPKVQNIRPNKLEHTIANSKDYIDEEVANIVAVL